jgi:hypothetical protein
MTGFASFGVLGLGISALDLMAIGLCIAGIGVTLALEVRSYSEKWGFRIFLLTTAIPFGLTFVSLFVWASASVIYAAIAAVL